MKTFLQKCLELLYTLQRQGKFKTTPGSYLLLTFSDSAKPTAVNDDFEHTLTFLVQDEKKNPLGKQMDIQNLTHEKNEEIEDIQNEEMIINRDNFYIMLTKEFRSEIAYLFEKIGLNQIKIYWEYRTNNPPKRKRK